MKPERRKAMMFRIPLFSLIMTTVAWVIYWRVAGSIPGIKDICLITHLGDTFGFGHLIINLPWAIPRCFLDAPFAPVFAAIIVYCLTHPKIADFPEGRYHWLAGGVCGLIAGVFCAFAEELGLGLGLAFIYAALIGLTFIFQQSLGFCVGFGLGFGAILGLALGLVGMVIVAGGMLIGPPVRVGLIYVFSPAPWVAIGRWLMAKDKE